MTLEEKYEAALRALLEKTGEEISDYRPSGAIQMLGKTPHEAVEAVKKIIMNPKSYGLKRLQKKGRLDLSIEQHLLDNSEFHPLFDEQLLERCRKILEEYKEPPRKS